MRRPVQSRMADKFHRGFVYTCMGLTAYGGYLLGMRVFRYFTVIKPETRAYEQTLVKHGSIEASQTDVAPQLKA